MSDGNVLANSTRAANIVTFNGATMAQTSAMSAANTVDGQPLATAIVVANQRMDVTLTFSDDWLLLLDAKFPPSNGQSANVTFTTTPPSTRNLSPSTLLSASGAVSTILWLYGARVQTVSDGQINGNGCVSSNLPIVNAYVVLRYDARVAKQAEAVAAARSLAWTGVLASPILPSFPVLVVDIGIVVGQTTQLTLLTSNASSLALTLLAATTTTAPTRTSLGSGQCGTGAAVLAAWPQLGWWGGAALGAAGLGCGTGACRGGSTAGGRRFVGVTASASALASGGDSTLILTGSATATSSSLGLGGLLGGGALLRDAGLDGALCDSAVLVAMRSVRTVVMKRVRIVGGCPVAELRVWNNAAVGLLFSPDMLYLVAHPEIVGTNVSSGTTAILSGVPGLPRDLLAKSDVLCAVFWFAGVGSVAEFKSGAGFAASTSENLYLMVGPAHSNPLSAWAGPVVASVADFGHTPVFQPGTMTTPPTLVLVGTSGSSSSSSLLRFGGTSANSTSTATVSTTLTL